MQSVPHATWTDNMDEILLSRPPLDDTRVTSSSSSSSSRRHSSSHMDPIMSRSSSNHLPSSYLRRRTSLRDTAPAADRSASIQTSSRLVPSFPLVPGQPSSSSPSSVRSVPGRSPSASRSRSPPSSSIGRSRIPVRVHRSQPVVAATDRPRFVESTRSLEHPPMSLERPSISLDRPHMSLERRPSMIAHTHIRVSNNHNRSSSTATTGHEPPPPPPPSDDVTTSMTHHPHRLRPTETTRRQERPPIIAHEQVRVSNRTGTATGHGPTTHHVPNDEAIARALHQSYVEENAANDAMISQLLLSDEPPPNFSSSSHLRRPNPPLTFAPSLSTDDLEVDALLSHDLFSHHEPFAHGAPTFPLPHPWLQPRRTQDSLSANELRMIQLAFQSGDILSEEENDDDEVPINRMTYEELVALCDSVDHVKSGLSQREINSFPVRAYGPDRSSSASHNAASPDPKPSVEDEECLICATAYESGDEIRTLPCFHAMHRTCLDRWLEQSTKCPVCLKDLKQDLS